LTPLRSAEGLIPVSMTENPDYVLLAGAKSPPEFIANLAVPMASNYEVRPGKTFRVEAKITNPLSTDLEVGTNWTLTPYLRPVGQTSGSVLIPAKETAVIGLDISAATIVPAWVGNPLHADLAVNIPSVGWTSKLSIPLHLSGTAVISGGDFSEQPQFELNNAQQIVNLAEHDPHTDHLMWKNAADLSAKFWLARKTSGVDARIETTDNVYHNPTASDMTTGDSVVIGLQGPAQSGLWRIALGEVDGKAVVRALEAPDGMSAEGMELEARIVTEGTKRTYSVSLSDSALGLSDEAWKKGVRISFLVNDNDGRGHKGWLEMHSGFGKAPDPKQFALIAVE